MNGDKQIFQDLVLNGWKTVLTDVQRRDPAYAERLKYEVRVISNMGFIRYFLIVQDIIAWARRQGIMVGPARGSAAGSLVCYLIGITQVDPVKHGLYFERFLNPERVSMPDIDVDFQDDRRDEVFRYIVDKYGADRVGHINTYGILTLKSAFRDVARVFEIPPLTVNALSKQIEDEESFDKVAMLSDFKRRHPEIVEQALKLVGTIRQQGVHACGMVIGSKPLVNLGVMERRNGGIHAINWDKDQCERFGLLKIDVLGLSTLSILNYAQELVIQRHGKRIVFTEIPLDDPKALSLFRHGRTVGVFQFEGAAMRSLLRSLAPDSFEAVVAVTALFRPGSLNSGQTERYVRISRGDEYENYVCDELTPILGETKGVLVYQEQIMQVFNQLGGFTWAEADTMRKIIGKKLGRDEFEKHREHFINGCREKEIEEAVAGKLFDEMAEFASYSFNKSHAVSYSMISFWSAYFKARFPEEFFTACLSYVNEERWPEIITDARSMGVRVDRPDINVSEARYILDGDRIVAPLGSIKGVGQTAVKAILEARKAGVFLNKEDMVERVNRRVVNKRVVGILERAGAFESLGIRERDAEQREKNFSELLPMYNILPSLSLKRKEKLNGEAVLGLYGECQRCAMGQGRSLIEFQIPAKAPAIMVINNAVKGEVAHLTNQGSRHLLTSLKPYGIGQRHLYYTSVAKCRFDKIADVPRQCLNNGLSVLRREIAVVRPRLILCCSGEAIDLFVPGGKLSKLNGRVKYFKEFDAYVLFSYSPQYAFYQPDRAGKQFAENMEKIGKIFEEDRK